MEISQLIERLPMGWRTFFQREKNQEYLLKLLYAYEQAKDNTTVFPPESEVFKSLEACDLLGVKAVILGQDPYHGEGQANGLAFSVRSSIKPPPSLRNIFKELQNDVSVDLGDDGDLSHWAEQGVLLLNSSLSVEEKKPGSHRHFGWGTLTDKIIALISTRLENVVYLLWGSDAQKKEHLIDHTKHLVIKSPHPSPLSAYRGFFGGSYFSRTNNYLKSYGKDPINWDRH